MKTCTQCNKSLTEESFHKARKRKDGTHVLTACCKICKNEARTLLWKTNPEKKANAYSKVAINAKLPEVTARKRQKAKDGKYKCGNCKIPVNHTKTKLCVTCFGKKFSGKKNPRWNPVLTDKERKWQRNTPEHKAWAKQVKYRDAFTCILCNEKGGRLNSHHLNAYSQFPEQRYDVNNGVTLCKACHSGFHNKYGNKTTKAQFEEFYNLITASSKEA